MSDENRYALSRRVTVVGIVTSFILAILKLLVGTLGASAALVADGFHSLGDVVCNFMVLFAARLGNLDADHNHPYGHRRIETFATLVLSTFLLVVGVGIAFEAIMHLVRHDVEKPDFYTLSAAILSVAANEGLFRYTLKAADKINSDLLRANAWHSRFDSLSSVIVLVGIMGALAGWTFLDAIAAIAVALFIGKMGIGWGWQAILELTDAGVDPKELEEIKAAILSSPGVLHMHQLRTRKMAGEVYLDVHILIEPHTSASEGHYFAETVRVTLTKKFANIKDVTVHVDVEEHPEQLPPSLPKNRFQLLENLKPQWNKWVLDEDIRHLSVFYLEGKIELQVHLALSVLELHGLDQLLEAFEKSKAVEPQVRSIKLLFTP